MLTFFTLNLYLVQELKINCLMLVETGGNGGGKVTARKVVILEERPPLVFSAPADNNTSPHEKLYVSL